MCAFRLKLVLKLSALECNCVAVNSVPVASIDLFWRALSTKINNFGQQEAGDKIGLCSHTPFNCCWKHPVIPKTVQIGRSGKKNQIVQNILYFGRSMHV